MAEKMCLVIPASCGCVGLCGFAGAKESMGIPPILQSFSHTWQYMPLVNPVGLENLPNGMAKDLTEDYPRSAKFMPRSICETDPNWKQLIPYAMITWNDQVLCYRRPENNAEPRLSNQRSLGFGGHIDPSDLAQTFVRAPLAQGTVYATNLVHAALIREVEEELKFKLSTETARRCQFIGYVNHDDTEVGAVHLGIVFHIELNGNQTFEPSDEIEGAELLSIDDAYAKIDEFELWSQFVLRGYKSLPRPAAVQEAAAQA